MKNIESILLSLKEKALEATKNADADFYKNYLDDRAIAVVPVGIFDKKAIVQQMSAKNSQFRSSKIENTDVIVVSADCGIVTYKATYLKPDKTPYEVFVTTVYTKVNDEWKGMFYQQTPLITPTRE